MAKYILPICFRRALTKQELVCQEPEQNRRLSCFFFLEIPKLCVCLISQKNQMTLLSILVYAHGFQKNCPFVLCWLFHENCRFCIALLNSRDQPVLLIPIFFPRRTQNQQRFSDSEFIFFPNQNRQVFENFNTRPTLV